MNVVNDDTEGNTNVKMLENWSTPRNKEVPNKPIPNQPVPNNEVPSDYARSEERITEGVIGAITYQAP